MKNIFTFCFINFTVLIYGQSIDELNLIANEQLKKYCFASTWQERLPLVLNSVETSKFMEKKYTEPFRNPNDTSSYMNKIYHDIITKPLIKDSKIDNYFKKSYSVIHNGKIKTGTYPFKLQKGNLLIDWQAMQGSSELSIKSFDLRKPTDYVLMRVKMILVEHKYEKELPDYFTVKIQQDEEGTSEYAIINKENSNSKLLLEELYDAKWHQKVIWIKQVGMASKDPNSYHQILENIRLIGFVNSVLVDSYYVEEENGSTKKISIESPSINEEQNQYQQKKVKIQEKEKQDLLLKEKKEQDRKEREYFNKLILSQQISLKQLNASRIEYYEKPIELLGYIELSDYYNYGYSKSESTHYSYKLRDPNGDIVQIYFLKSKSKTLFDILSQKDKIAVKVKVVASSNLQEKNFGNVLLEGISFEKLEFKE